PRLLDRVAGAARHRLTLLHADAGYGKTTLLVQYADLLRASGKRAAWLTLHRTDEDPLVLVTDLIGAARRELPDFGARILTTLQRSRRLEQRLGRLAEACAEELRGAGELVFLIDDHWQLRPNAHLVGFANDLLEALPANAHIVLALREILPLPGLPRWRLSGDVLDLSAAQLAFTRDEAAALLRGEFGLDLPDHAIDTLYERTGGWPAGLRIAAAFVRERGWADLRDFRGTAAQLYEYFDREVLGRRSRRATDLLLRWSLLDRVEEESARLIIGHEARSVIETLERAGLMQRDAQAGGYRFQPLFSEFLRARAREMLPAADIVDLHRRFAESAIESGSNDQAVYHLQQAGDYHRAAGLVKDRGEELLASSEVTTLQRWLDGFPPGVERRLPWVILMRGVLHRVRGDYERAHALYGTAEEEFRRAKDTAGLARALVWSAQALRYLRRPREALERVREGLACLGEGASLQAAWALHVLGGCYQDVGEMSAAIDAYVRADRLFGLVGHAPGQLTEAHAIAQLHHTLGNLDEAQRNYLRALNLQQTTGDVNILCWTQGGLVDLRVRRGDLSDASDTLAQAREMARANGLGLSEAAICSTSMVVSELAGDVEARERAYRDGLDASVGQGDTTFLLRLHLFAAELRALRGDLAGAQDALRAAEAVGALE
ncbi:MAG: tetratricopeptide repeat protein, partial [Candidatus Limnocylindria bacterium]